MQSKYASALQISSNPVKFAEQTIDMNYERALKQLQTSKKRVYDGEPHQDPHKDHINLSFLKKKPNYDRTDRY